MTSNKDVLARLEKTGFKFLITDLDLALTLTKIASDSDEDSEKRTRNQTNARQAYDTLLSISTRALLTEGQREEVKEKLQQLRSALEQLGEVIA